jgi:predicted ATPase/DNA-binding CsgD family transcriptional regulator
MNGGTAANQRDRLLALDALTPRERDILQLMVADRSNAEIAERLVMTLGTVRWYVSEIYSKLGVHSRDEAIARAADLNLASQAQAAPPTPTNLPARTTSLVGREREIAAVRLLILREEVRLLTLVGTPGIGKTRLSLETAATFLSEFPDGVYFVPLAPISDPTLVANTIAQSLSIHETGEQPITEMLKHYLREKSLLLVLDNFEHLLPAAPLVAELLAASSNLKVLATSREALRLYGEQEYPVPPLALPDPKRSDGIETLGECEAVALFVRRAQAAKPIFELTQENANAIADICVCLDGLPLAIELAAARVKIHTPNALLVRLNKRLSALTSGARDLPERQQTLRGAIAWSYELLDEGEKTLFAQLGVFVGGWSLEAMEAVCVGATHGSPLHIDVYDGLESLLNKSLVQQIGSAIGEPRFTMLETLREYALEKLAESGEEETLRRAHCDYFLRLAEVAEAHAFGREQIAWFDRLEVEFDNLRAALAWSLRGGVADKGLQLAAALGWFFSQRMHWTEGLAWIERTLAVSQNAPVFLRAKALQWAGGLDDDGARKRAFCEQALSLARAANDRWNIAWALSNLGSEDTPLDLERAAATLDESLRLFRELEDAMGLCHTLIRRSKVASMQRDYAYMRVLAEEALVAAREVDDLVVTGWVHFVLGQVSKFHDHDLKQAETHYESSLSVFREARSSTGVVVVGVHLAQIEQGLGNNPRAQTLFKEALFLLKEQRPHGIYIELAFVGLANLAGAHGQLERAANLLAAVNRDTLVEHYTTFSELDDFFESDVASVRAQLGEDRFAEAWAVGNAMTREQAIVYALSETP